ncbi:thr operon leader peptide [Pluralibacter gergoviae]|uniref:thr operon leader peptide n=1 Tax=Pluralibacter gergoviae TaxID=61647 RepID=A0AAI9DI78_PLUGE|nr:thr operon leader peptide [Pluralibacter gergoviae]MDU4390116.1 thr operon leader peptide [Klebsiella michiganensis]EKT9639021.1 thr operon leader peptide [Pluralibacter gergoviae]EKV0914081.1 thr operon leader peptide [Pluralibacter gergoviae]EKV0929607.1 thr operon leader peptide [Pluralibacter gergoviae]EKV3542165.1 thr operon leader peptide [Pluralibacter gergoviae]
MIRISMTTTITTITITTGIGAG